MSSSIATLGLSEELPRSAAEDLRGMLIELWRAAHRREPLGLRPDLIAQHTYFNPVASGKRLRAILAALEPVTFTTDLPAPLALRIDEQRILITPEGRVAIELIEAALRKPGGSVYLDTAAAERYSGNLLALYREWGWTRLNQVIDYLGGGEAPLQLPAIGATLTLLVNRSDAPERSIKRFGVADRVAQTRVDEAFFRSASAFTREIPARRRASGPSRGTSEKERLISGWTLHEVTRRLPGALVINDDQVYIASEHTDQLIGLIARELRRRKEIDASVLESAFDALVVEFRRQAPVLAGFGMLYERPVETAKLRAGILDEFDACAAA